MQSEGGVQVGEAVSRPKTLHWEAVDQTSVLFIERNDMMKS